VAFKYNVWPPKINVNVETGHIKKCEENENKKSK